RLLLALTIALAVGAAVGTIALGINLVDSFTDTDALILAAGGFAAAAVAGGGLLPPNPALRRPPQVEAPSEAAPAECPPDAGGGTWGANPGAGGDGGRGTRQREPPTERAGTAPRRRAPQLGRAPG